MLCGGVKGHTRREWVMATVVVAIVDVVGTN